MTTMNNHRCHRQVSVETCRKATVAPADPPPLVAFTYLPWLYGVLSIQISGGGHDRRTGH